MLPAGLSPRYAVHLCATLCPRSRPVLPMNDDSCQHRPQNFNACCADLKPQRRLCTRWCPPEAAECRACCRQDQQGCPASKEDAGQGGGRGQPAALCVLCLMMALHLLLWSAQQWSSKLVSTSLPSTLEALLAAFFLQLRSAHLGICWGVYCAAQPSRGVCLRVCLTMPEQRCYHMQGKAAQTKRGPAPRAVAPAKVNAKPGVRQSATHTTRTSASMTRTSTGAVQVVWTGSGMAFLHACRLHRACHALP